MAVPWNSLFIGAFRGEIALGSFSLSELDIRHGEYVCWAFLGMWIGTEKYIAAHHTIKVKADIDGQKRTVCALFALVLRMPIAMFPSGALAVDKQDSAAS